MKRLQIKAIKANERRKIRNYLESRGIISPNQRLKQHHVDYVFEQRKATEKERLQRLR